MPDRADFLSGLTTAGDQGYELALAWHVVGVAVILAVAAGWRPSRGLVGLLLAVPLASVSLMAVAVGNPFNAAVFGALAVALAVLAAAWGEREPITRGPLWSEVLGAGMVTFGWVYPHFLGRGGPLAYAYAAPMGLIPSPTLAVVVGAALLTRPGKATWSWVLAGAAAFYGAFGVARLGVWLDLGLLVGAVALVASTQATAGHGPPREWRARHRHRATAT